MNRFVANAVLGVFASLSACGATASDVAGPVDHRARVPDTAAARASADLIARAERAVNAYITGCVRREIQTLERVTTNDARIEYALDEEGMFLSIDAASIEAGCGPLAHGTGQRSSWWILPTSETSSVFVQYDTADGRQLALVEMQGDRISRLVNFASAPQALLAKYAVR